jgi:Na+-transporting NADH:ubiquinone oxidoreductase subunit NqrC
MQWLLDNWQTIALIVTGTISVASIIVKLTPTQKDDAVLAQVIKFLAVIGLNKDPLVKPQDPTKL